MSVTASIIARVRATETLANTPSATGDGAEVVHDQYDETHSLTASTTPPVTKCAYWLQALSGGAATVNLAALTGTEGATVDMTGLKVQALHVKNLGAAALTIVPGASNGYDFMTGGVIVLLQNQEWLFYGNDATPDVASGDRTIDLTGTTTQTSEWSVICG